jgi:hypothetical protein
MTGARQRSGARTDRFGCRPSGPIRRGHHGKLRLLLRPQYGRAGARHVGGNGGARRALLQHRTRVGGEQVAIVRLILAHRGVGDGLASKITRASGARSVGGSIRGPDTGRNGAMATLAADLRPRFCMVLCLLTLVAARMRPFR